MLVFVNGVDDRLPEGCYRIKLERETADRPIFVGVTLVADTALGEPGTSGVTVLAGMNPDAQAGDSMDFLFVRGE